MPEVIEHNSAETRGQSDKVGFFRIVDGKVQPREEEKWEELPPHDPSWDTREYKAITPEQIEEKKKVDMKELADSVNNLMAESEKPAEENKGEVLPVLDRMLRATTLEEFDALCDQGGGSLTIEGKAFTGAELKQIVSEAKQALEQKKVASAAKILRQIPQGPLLEKLEQIVDPGQLIGIINEVHRAYL